MGMGKTLAFILWPLLAIAGEERPTQIFTVDSMLDEPDVDTSDGACRSASGVCTLRAAVMQASVLTGPTVFINLPAGTYTITQPIDPGGQGNGGSLFLGAPLDGVTTVSIVGENTATTIIDGAQIDRVFTIAAGRTATIANLTVRNGNSTSAGGGGGIENEGVLTLDHVAVTNCSAPGGGGVASGFSSTLHIFNSSISNNTALDAGGLFSGGILDITASTFGFNTAVSGGAMYLEGTSFLLNTTIAGNKASAYGGGLVLSDATVNIYNSTIAFNVADSDADNVGSGGGVYLFTDGLNIYNTLIAGNYHINPAFDDDCDGPLKTHAYNRFGNTSQCTITQVSGAYALLNSIADLGLLQNNGGPTQTIALLAGSNAINGAVACFDQNSTPITADQRGFPRNIGACDIGAFEFGSIDPNDKIFYNGFQSLTGP